MPLYLPQQSGPSASDELSRVPWGTLGHAHSGAALDTSSDAVARDDIEAILRALVDLDDEEMPVEGYHLALDTLWHQGTIFEATAHAVPFLAAFAADPSLPRRGYPLALLTLIAASARRPSPHQAAVVEAIEASRPWLDQIASHGPELAAMAARFILERNPSFDAEALAEILEGWAERDDD